MSEHDTNAEPGSEPILEVDGLTIQYQTQDDVVTGVSNASFSINEREFFGLIGESGSGKSTLAKAVVGGLDQNGFITSGTIKYRGTEIQDYSEDQLNEEIRWNEIAYIPQASMNSLDPIERIDKQAVRIGRAHTDLGEPALRGRLRELFEVVGLPPERMSDYPYQLSGGMKQRAIIAVSLLLEPKLLIADEPTTALDVIMQDKIFKYLTEIKSSFDTSLLLITHDISVTFELCKRMSIMHAGQICEIGTAETIFDNPRHPYTVALQDSFPNMRELEEKLGTIEGHPPELTGDTPGTYCHFADRCPLSTEMCRNDEPLLELFEESSNHYVACFHDDEISTIRDETIQQSSARQKYPEGTDDD
jgi:oligopeptide/dipeptide ABC transporter ATP-binding protein